MKRKKVLSLVLLFVVTIVLPSLIIGCSKANENPSSPEAQANSEAPASTVPADSDWWQPDMDCSACHSQNVASLADSSCLAYAHAQAGNTCIDCHEQDVLQEKHQVPVEVPESITLRMTKEECFECHGSMEEIIARTADSTVFQTVDGNYINPHVTPSETHEADVQCYSCHRMHITYDSRGYCYSCHHTGELTCYTCH